VKIDLTNYEEKFLDYHDGNLSAEEVAELFLFIEKHPELKEEFESFENISINDSDTNIAFPDKNFIKQLTTPSIETIDQWLIAEMEGELNLQQRVLLSTFLKDHPQFEKDRSLFRSTKLTSGIADIFPDKESLKRKAAKPIALGITSRMWYSAAAVLILIIGAWYVLVSPSVKPETASITPIKIDSSSVQAGVSQIDTITSANTNTNVDAILKRENKSVEHPQIANKKKSNTRHKVPAKQQPTSTEENFANKNTVQPDSIQDINVANNITIDSVPQSNEPVPPLQPEETAMSEENKSETTSQENLTTKSKFIRWVANIVNKVSDDKLKVKTTFDPTSGDLAAYRVEMGKNSWQKIKDY
jgi:hypothetical protein